MSFDSLSRLESQVIPSSRYSDNLDFDTHIASLLTQISSINNSVSQLSSLLGQIGGRRDSETLREDVKKLLVEARDQFKLTEEAVRIAQFWEGLSRSQRYTSQKLSDAFSTLLHQFQSLQRISTEKTSQCILGTSPDGSKMQPQLQPLVMAEQSEVEFQKSMVLQRQQDIKLVQDGVESINDTYKSIATLLSTHGEVLDTIGRNVDGVARDIMNTDYELWQANKSQKRARQRTCCLLLFCTVLFGVVLLAVVSG